MGGAGREVIVVCGRGIVITMGIDRIKGCITALDKLLAWEPSCFIMISMMIT